MKIKKLKSYQSYLRYKKMIFRDACFAEYGFEAKIPKEIHDKVMYYLSKKYDVELR